MANLTVEQVATAPAFQLIALTEAFKTLERTTGISFESLVEQFPTNEKLQATCAKMLVEAAKMIASK